MTYAEFWPQYLRAHGRASTRRLHYAGTLLAVGTLAVGVAALDWRWLLAAPLIGYGLAWTAHVALEGNRPQTFGHPLWSLASDVRMAWLWFTGRLAPELERAGVQDRR